MRGSKGHPGRSRLWFAALALAATALIAAGCGGDDDDSGDSGDPMTVGLSLPLTGEFSQPGKAAKQGYEIWAETVNEEGGLLGRQVELEIKDDGSDQNTVVADYNALIQKDNVDLLLGHLLVAAQPPGLRRGRAQPDALRRAGRRRAGDLRARLPVRAVLHAAGHRGSPGRPVRGVGPRPARERAAEDGRPTRCSTIRSRCPWSTRSGRHSTRPGSRTSTTRPTR